MKNHLLLALFVSAGSASLVGQSASLPSAEEANQPGEIVQMSQFEVSTTQGHGYVFTNAAEAFKTSDSLMNIPQIDVVVTADLVKDIGYENTTDTLSYFGVYTSFEAEGGKFRGGGAGTQFYVDEFPIHSTWSDPATIDSLELIKGGAEGLYMLNSGPGGLVMKSEKKPQPIPMTSISASIDQFGLYHAWVDSTGPMGKINDVQLSYRLILGVQHGHTYFDNIIDNRFLIYPYFQANYHNTTVRFHVDAESQDSSQLGAEIITPSGKLYTGAGRSVSNQPPNNSNTIWEKIWEASIMQKFGEGWEMRLGGQYSDTGYFGPQVITSGSSWSPAAPNPYIYYTNRLDHQHWMYWTVVSDITGKYNLGFPGWQMPQQDIIGWAFTSQINQKYSYTTTTVPFSDSANGRTLLPGESATALAVPANSRAAINAIVVPPRESYYYPPASAGTQLTTVNGGLYFQHTASVIPNWLDLILGESWINVTNDSIADVSKQPWMAADTHADQYVHRVAALVHLGKSVSIYALSATSFSPGSSIAFLANGSVAPPQGGKDNELGMKTAFLGGKLSSDFSWFSVYTTNVTQAIGVFPNGQSYYTLVGGAVEEGVDGDIALTLVPGWQLVGSFYAGHDRDTLNRPVSGTWDNSWGFFTRYDFQKNTVLHGLGVGVGMEQIGGRWISTSGVANATALLLPSSTVFGNIKVQNGQMMNGFVEYSFNKHITAAVYLTNLLDEIYPLATQTAYEADAPPPRSFRFQATYRF